jgi:hypothetical protein
MTFRSDNSNISTNRLLSENDLTAKYNQYKRNLGLAKNETDKNYSTQILSDIDNDSLDKYSNLRKVYDERIKSLYDQIGVIANNFENDEILNTMKQDCISTEFFHQRMKEIIEDNLFQEKEEVIARLSDEVADLRTKLNDMNKMRGSSEEDLKAKHLENLLNESYETYLSTCN